MTAGQMGNVGLGNSKQHNAIRLQWRGVLAKGFDLFDPIWEGEQDMRLSKATMKMFVLALAGGMLLVIPQLLADAQGLKDLAAGGDPDCEPVSGSGATSQEIPGEGPFVGSAIVQIGDEVFEASVVTVLLTEPVPVNFDPFTLAAMTSHTFTFDDDDDDDDDSEGSFTTVDMAILTAVTECEFTLQSNLVIVSGAEDFQDVGEPGFFQQSQLGIDGTINLCLGEASFTFEGQICFGDDDDDDGDNGDLEAAREAVEIYEDLDQALADGYELITECFSDPVLGAQGFHFLNFALLDGVLDPTKPEILMYIPTEDGLEFVGLEYAVPADLVPPIPTLFGQEFHPFPPAPDAELFVLHVWLLEDVPNPSGLFADWNPNLSCD